MVLVLDYNVSSADQRALERISNLRSMCLSEDKMCAGEFPKPIGFSGSSF